MAASGRHFLGRWLPLAVVAAICALTGMVAGDGGRGGPPWYGIVPPLLAVALALATGRMLLSLGAAVLAAGWLAAVDRGRPLHAVALTGPLEAARFVRDTLVDVKAGQYLLTANQQILLFVVLVMVTVGVMLAGGGLQGVADRLARWARDARSTRLAAALAGIIVFIDDYASTMIVGPTLRPLADRQRISREKLAFLVDATTAPVAGVAVLSTWIGYEVGLLGEMSRSLALGQDGYAMFFDALPFRFYCLLMLGFVLLGGWTGWDFGPMARAERRARTTGKLLADGARPLGGTAPATAFDPTTRHRARVALAPLAALVGAFLVGLWLDGGGWDIARREPARLLRFGTWREVLIAADNIAVLAIASSVGLATAVLMALAVARVSLQALGRGLVAGLRASLLPVGVLLLAWSLKNGCETLLTGAFLAETLAARMSPEWFPPVVFVVASLTSFATGTSWGTMAILIPTALPVAFHLDGGAYGLTTMVTVGAILDGAIFGDHCSPISDTTIMSSTSSGCDHLDHVRTQMPYSLLVAALALGFCYLPASRGVASWITLPTGLVAMALSYALLARLARRRDESH